MRALGLKLFAPDSPSDAITAVCAPEGLDSGAILQQVRSQFGLALANGQSSLKGRIFRIAHLGYVDLSETLGLLASLEIALQTLHVPVSLGAGVRAAQEIYLRETEKTE